MADSQHHDILKCPFCLSHGIEAKLSKTSCPECSAEFEIDDRLECVFVHPNKLRLPLKGLVCSCCGLVQELENSKCVFCEAELRTTVQ